MIVAIFAALMVAPGCAHKPYEDPVAAMSDEELNAKEQIRAMRQASVDDPANPERIRALKRVLSTPGHTLSLRKEAFELLYRHDPEDARTTLMYRLPSLTSWDFIEFACGRVADEGWTEFRHALVRSLARPTARYAPEERPERRALDALFPDQDVRQTVFDVVAEPTDNPVFIRWRDSAWEALNDLGDAEPWRDQLLALETSDPFLVDMQAAAQDLGVIPRTAEEVKWARTLREPQYADWWSQARAIVSTLPEEIQRELELRHLAPLVRVSEAHPEWLDRSKEELYSIVTATLGGRRHITPSQLSASYRAQSLDDARERLKWADLVTIRLANELAFSPAIRAELFRQAAHDQGDKSTEYGGVLDLGPEGPMAEMFSPRIRQHDMKFFATKQMVIRGYTAPFHYHFHVQEKNNHEYAGPGLGDLEYANALGINGVVFTSVGGGKLNADFYTVDQIVIDLGVIEDE